MSGKVKVDKCVYKEEVQRDREIQEVLQHVKNHMMIYLKLIWKKFNKVIVKNFKIDRLKGKNIILL